MSGAHSNIAIYQRKPGLMDDLRQALQARHYSKSTVQTYCLRVKRYIYLHNVKHPAEMAESEINAFLTHLAVRGEVSVSTQNQSRQSRDAILFRYRHVLKREVGEPGNIIRARKSKRLPVVNDTRGSKSCPCTTQG